MKEVITSHIVAIIISESREYTNKQLVEIEEKNTKHKCPAYIKKNGRKVPKRN